MSGRPDNRLYPQLGEEHQVQYTKGSAGGAQETVLMVDQPNMSEVEQKWKPIFNQLDVEGRGQIPAQQLARQLHDQCEADRCGITIEKRAHVLRRADADRDGAIDVNEFARMMNAEDSRYKKLVFRAANLVVPKSLQDDELISYLDHYTCCPPPLFILLVTVAELVLYCYYAVEMDEFSATGPVPLESELIYNPYRRKEAWRYISYMFIHVGYVHIFFNCLVQVILGLPLELVHKMHRIGLIYLAGVIAGSLGTSLVDPFTFLAGASGGVYAIIAAHMSNVIINWSEMPFRWFTLIFLLLLGGTDVGVAIWQRYRNDPESQKIGYAAHFAGALAGLLMGFILLKNLKVRKWERVLWWVSLVALALLLAGSVAWNALWDEHFPEQHVRR